MPSLLNLGVVTWFVENVDWIEVGYFVDGGLLRTRVKLMGNVVVMLRD